MSQSRYEWLLAKFASLDKRITELKTRECETSAALASVVKRYEDACKAYALDEGGDPEPIRRDRQKFEAELCGIRGAIQDCETERAGFQSEWEAVTKEKARQEREQAKESARRVHASLLEKRLGLLKQVDELDMQIQNAFFEWDRFLIQERLEREQAAQDNWKRQASEHAPGARRMVVIGGGQ